MARSKKHRRRKESSANDPSPKKPTTADEPAREPRKADPPRRNLPLLIVSGLLLLAWLIFLLAVAMSG